MDREMRRKDRLLNESDTWEILNNGKYGVLAVIGENGYPYSVPLHYVLVDNSIYFHSTVEGGYREECLKKDNKVSFTVVETEDGVKARSAIVFGTAEPVPDSYEMVLEKIVEKFVPVFAWRQAKSGIPHAKENVMAYKVNIEQLTGKWIDKPEGR
jgi:nitroimidazol reductase NimA-like FMN-containing flavoprotein (pyridoxamine 5'-phosphate oxidase superfamily)